MISLMDVNDFIKENHIDSEYDIHGNTLLHLAAFQQRVGIVSQLLQLGANPNVVNKANKTPLYLGLDNTLVIDELIKYSANVNACVCWDNMPLVFYLVEDFDTLELRRFVEAGILINIKNKQGQSLRNFAENVTSSSSRLMKYIRKIFAKRRWKMIKCVTKFLAVHQRAVISANHPLRLLELGIFEKK